MCGPSYALICPQNLAQQLLSRNRRFSKLFQPITEINFPFTENLPFLNHLPFLASKLPRRAQKLRSRRPRGLLRRPPLKKTHSCLRTSPSVQKLSFYGQPCVRTTSRPRIGMGVGSGFPPTRGWMSVEEFSESGLRPRRCKNFPFMANRALVWILDELKLQEEMLYG